MSTLAELEALLGTVAPAGTPYQRHDATSLPSCFEADLPDMRRMAAQGMTIVQIAARLGYRPHALEDAARRLRDVYDALIGGRAEGIDLVTGALYGAAVAGDMTAASLYLKRKAGWEAPRVAPGPSVVVNLGGQPAAIDATHIDAMATQHSDLLDRLANGELEAEATETETAKLAPPTVDLAGFVFEAETADQMAERDRV